MDLKFLPVHLYCVEEPDNFLKLCLLTRKFIWTYRTNLYWDIWEKYRGEHRRKIRQTKEN
ncbi:hypothetical protein [Coleofasciculus sp. G1-WW12-02]|uniref:hypothetical protein n=1 Tax=Coleofasciculus sp. G1-WW12-02 TaxID=3068483 RepID=UPI0040640300